MTATRKRKLSTETPSQALYVAFELGESSWKLACTIGMGQKPRLRGMPGRDLPRLQQEIAKAKKRFGLPENAPVHSCYEAGRDGFWLHRHLTAQGIANKVVDSASIEVNRRKRRAKTDRLDAVKLVNLLLRYHNGEAKVWSINRVPNLTDEDARQLHRELEALKDERTSHVNRIKGLLVSQGLEAPEVKKDFADWLNKARLWDGSQLPKELHQRLLRELERWELLERQIKDLEKQRCRRICREDTPHVDRGQQKSSTGLVDLRSWQPLGTPSAWLFLVRWHACRAGLRFTRHKSIARGQATGPSRQEHLRGTTFRRVEDWSGRSFTVPSGVIATECQKGRPGTRLRRIASGRIQTQVHRPQAGRHG